MAVYQSQGEASFRLPPLEVVAEPRRAVPTIYHGHTYDDPQEMQPPYRYDQFRAPAERPPMAPAPVRPAPARYPAPQPQPQPRQLPRSRPTPRPAHGPQQPARPTYRVAEPPLMKYSPAGHQPRHQRPLEAGRRVTGTVGLALAAAAVAGSLMYVNSGHVSGAPDAAAAETPTIAAAHRYEQLAEVKMAARDERHTPNFPELRKQLSSPRMTKFSATQFYAV